MLIPNFVNMPLVDKEGNMSPEWAQSFTQLLTELQLNLNNEGFRLPALTSAQIAQLTDADKSTGAMVYNSTSHTFMVNIAGTWKTVTVT